MDGNGARAVATAALVALLALPAAASARALMAVPDAAGLAKSCDAGIAQARRTMAAMERERGPGRIFDEWNRLAIAIEDVGAPAYLLSSVHPDKAVRDAAEPCLQKFTTLNTDLFQSEKLFRRVEAARPANPRQAKLRKDLLEGFEDSGAALPPEKRARAKAIFDELEELRQAYDRNVRDDPTKVTFTPAEMEGLPEAYLAARQKDAQGNYVLGLDYPSYFPFMTRAKSGAARERYYRAKLREGGEANLGLLEKIFALRKELAALYGLPSFAAYALRHRMVRDPQTVEKFLGQVHDAVGPLEKKEVDELAAEKARDVHPEGTGGTPPAETRVERWDISYYQDKLRRARYAVDKEAMRRYFPTDKAIAFTMLVSQRLYGVKFREAKVASWHPDVRYFDVVDGKTGRFIGGFYLDLYPREGKYNHAAAFPIRGASRLAHRTPLAALVTNFNREGLDPDELETMMHEFGHVLHNVLSEADYNPDAGTAVKQDFVEAPSQMFQEWARREEPLALFREVCAECPQLTHEDIGRLEAAHRYGMGILYARQWLYATFDMALSVDPRPPLAVWKALEAATPLGHVEGTMFPASFSHIASNYAAGYYGYMWSEVLALDMLSAFGNDLLDPKVGARYRKTILSQGGQREETDMVRDFLGREPSSDAFFAEITGKR
jgi:thimet oligopeptidase